MAKKKDNNGLDYGKHFTFWEGYYNTVERLPDDIRLKCYDGIFQYIFKDKAFPQEDPIVYSILTGMKVNLDGGKKWAEDQTEKGISVGTSNGNEEYSREKMFKVMGAMIAADEKITAPKLAAVFGYAADGSAIRNKDEWKEWKSGAIKFDNQGHIISNRDSEEKGANPFQF